MYDVEQSSRRNNKSIINASYRTRVRFRYHRGPRRLLQLRLRGVYVQSAAFCLCLCLCLCIGFCFRLCFRGSLGNLDPCDARVGGCVGGYRRSILIVDRLYYRIIRLGLFFLGLSRCFLLLFLPLLLL